MVLPNVVAHQLRRGFAAGAPRPRSSMSGAPAAHRPAGDNCMRLLGGPSLDAVDQLAGKDEVLPAQQSNASHDARPDQS